MRVFYKYLAAYMLGIIAICGVAGCGVEADSHAASTGAVHHEGDGHDHSHEGHDH